MNNRNSRERPPADAMQLQHPANNKISAPRVRVIDENGENRGIMDTRQAMGMARDRDLDLVLIAGASDPPVAKITDYNKFLYQAKQAKKEQDKKSRESQIVVKEIQLRPVTGQHDIEVKLRHAREWLCDSNRIKVVMKFKGRENSHIALGLSVMQGFIERLGECRVEQPPEMQGRNMIAMIAPAKA